MGEKMGESEALNIGSIVRFGKYDWRILDVQDGKALLLSENVLAIRKYHSENTEITWATCDLRQYLNTSFLDDTFTSDEKTRMAETTISTKDNQWFGTPGGIDTVDKIFLLSLEETVKYFGDSGHLSNRPDYSYQIQGDYDSYRIDDEYNSSRIAVDKDNGNAQWWWLRSPGCRKNDATYIRLAGLVNMGDVLIDVITYSGGVRPALWLNL